MSTPVPNVDCQTFAKSLGLRFDDCAQTTCSLTPILVVIDMQTGFNAAANKPTREAVLQLITHAIREGYVVLIVEFVLCEPNVCGSTYKELVAPLKESSYPNWRVVTKDAVDGSVQIVAALSEIGVTDANFAVCGICTHGCVQHTVEGLADLRPNSRIIVAKEGCHQDLTGNDWSRFTKRANVFTVNAA